MAAPPITLNCGAAEGEVIDGADGVATPPPPLDAPLPLGTFTDLIAWICFKPDATATAAAAAPKAGPTIGIPAKDL